MQHVDRAGKLKTLVGLLDGNRSVIANKIADYFGIPYERARTVLSIAVIGDFDSAIQQLDRPCFVEAAKSPRLIDRASMSRVYFIAAPSARLIKIGVTINLASREKELRAMSPIPLVRLGHMAGDFVDEQALHFRFQHLRDHGEWFSDAPEIRAFITENTSGEMVA